MGRKKSEHAAENNGTPLTAEQRAEQKRQRFLKLAPKRVSNALKALRNVGRLANKASYTYTQEEQDKILLALGNAHEALIDNFAKDRPAVPVFTL